MTKPEMTKNTSTPTKPPGTGSSAWKSDDEQDGDGAQALDVATPAGRAAGRRGGRSGPHLRRRRHRRSPVTTRTTPPTTTVRPDDDVARDRLAQDDEAEEDGHDRVDVRVGGGERQRGVAEQPGEGAVPADGRGDQVGPGPPRLGGDLAEVEALAAQRAGEDQGRARDAPSRRSSSRGSCAGRCNVADRQEK